MLSLKRHLFNTPQAFNSDLTHGGIKAGEIRWASIVKSFVKIGTRCVLVTRHMKDMLRLRVPCKLKTRMKKVS